MMTPLLPLWDHAEPFDLIPLWWFCGLCLLMAVHGLYVWLKRRRTPDRRADDWAAEGEGVGRW